MPPKHEHDPEVVDSVDPEVLIDISCGNIEVPVESNWIDKANGHKTVSATRLFGKAKAEELKKDATLKEPSKKVLSSSHEESK